MENIIPIKELELYLIRHGQSIGNAGLTKENPSLKEFNDPCLSSLGIEQAKKLGLYFSDICFDEIYSSALIRAVQTATEIIKQQPMKKELNILPLLTEMGIQPDYLGCGMDEIRKIYPDSKLANGVDKNDSLIVYNSPDDEDGMFERAKTAIKYFRSRYKNGEKIAVVNHAAFNTYLVFHLMGFSKTPVFDIDFRNTGVTKVTFYKHGTNKYGDIIFDYINNTKHLLNKSYESK